ncbi:V-type ATP synthase subunit I [Chlamydiifrater phoenicopteri]|uniref:V-type ATP synthase subunit I n=1 Tax=Chlamydiifrater phoenicopteri TaxID=2681469 RepID=UPI001BCEC823|nr:V-type ATP synthase subunit I [Chlamydiifrater phoenicopteri]
MRVDIKKCLFIATSRVKEDFFLDCRSLEAVEFFSKEFTFSERVSGKHAEAVKILRRLGAEFSLEELKIDTTNFQLSVEEIIEEVLRLDREAAKLKELLKAVNKEILRVQPLGRFSTQDIEDLCRRTGLSVRYFYRRHIDGDPIEVNDENVFHISTAHNFDYYVVIGVVNLSKDRYTEIVVKQSFSELQERGAELQKEIREKTNRLLEFHSALPLIIKDLYERINYTNLSNVEKCSSPAFNGKLFSITGWVVANRMKELAKICEAHGVWMEEVFPDEGERIPTHLENTGLGAIGEDLVNIYDTPSSADLDPSTWVFISFALFFSMIINDAGYGLLFLLSSLWFKFRSKKKPSGLKRRFLKMATILGGSCIVWGLATASFFGVSFSSNSIMNEISLTRFLALKKAEYFLEKKPSSYKKLIVEYPILKEKTSPKEFLMTKGSRSGGEEVKYLIYDKFIDNILMEISLFVGIVHIMLGIIRNFRRAPTGVGWLLFLVGGYLYFPIYLNCVSLIHYFFKVPYAMGGELGLYFLLGGIGLASVIAVIKDKWKGIGELTVVIQVFSDVLSYLRIYALGLAGAMMGATFNSMGAKLSGVFGALVILLGHSVNIVLSIMGGVIHGLRLNFIEWYHYCFEGGGKKLNPFRRIAQEDE